MLWQILYSNKRTIFFVDNEGTKLSLLRGLSDMFVFSGLAASALWHALLPVKPKNAKSRRSKNALIELIEFCKNMHANFHPRQLIDERQRGANQQPRSVAD